MASFRHCTSARVEDMNLCGTLLSHLSERWDSLMDMWVERLLISAYCDRHEYHEVMGCRHRGTRLQVARWLFYRLPPHPCLAAMDPMDGALIHCGVVAL